MDTREELRTLAVASAVQAAIALRAAERVAAAAVEAVASASRRADGDRDLAAAAAAIASEIPCGGELAATTAAAADEATALFCRRAFEAWNAARRADEARERLAAWRATVEALGGFSPWEEDEIEGRNPPPPEE